MSRLLSNIPKRRRVLVEVIEDGSAKTFIYKDLDVENKSPSFLARLLGRRRKTRNLRSR